MQISWPLWKYLLKYSWSSIPYKGHPVSVNECKKKWVSCSVEGFCHSLFLSPTILSSWAIYPPPLSASCGLGLKCEYCGDLEAHIKVCHAQTDQDRHRKTETVAEAEECLCKWNWKCVCVFASVEPIHYHRSLNHQQSLISISFQHANLLNQRTSIIMTLWIRKKINFLNATYMTLWIHSRALFFTALSHVNAATS